MEEVQTRLDNIAHTQSASLGQATEALVWRGKEGGRLSARMKLIIRTHTHTYNREKMHILSEVVSSEDVGGVFRLFSNF